MARIHRDRPATGNYNFDIRVANGNPSGNVHIEFDGVDKTGSIEMPYTGKLDDLANCHRLRART